MLERMRLPLCHLMGRRAARAPYVPSHRMAKPPPPPCTCKSHVQDCAPVGEPEVLVIDCAAWSGPDVVSLVMTGYIGREPGPANHVELAAGQDSNPGADR